MTPFHKFPHIPHIAWLGEGTPRDDKLMEPSACAAFLSHVIVAEEKLDGANLGVSIGPDDGIRVQNRGSVLLPPFSGQFKALDGWLTQHRDRLIDVLGDRLLLFGEWCALMHSVNYAQLPSWFIGFDIFDLGSKRFWSSARRNKLLNSLSIHQPKEVACKKLSLDALKKALDTTPSEFGASHMEGLVLRRESADWLEDRAKLVRGDFTQAIATHWRRRSPEPNQLARCES